MKMKLPVISIANNNNNNNNHTQSVKPIIQLKNATYYKRLAIFPLIDVVRIKVMANQNGP